MVMHWASTSKWRRSASRDSLRPMPSVPKENIPPGTQGLSCSERIRNVVGRGNDGAFNSLQLLLEVGSSRGLAGVEHIPALALLRVAAKLVVAGDAPDIAGDAVVLGK